MSVSQPLTVVALALGLAAAAGAAERALPMTGWQLEVRTGDTVQLEQAAGQLRLGYDVAIDLPRRDGHLSQTVGSFRLLLARPLPLAADEQRVRFTACGLDPQTVLRPLIADATGEVFSYVPSAGDLLLRRSDGGWADWRSCTFWSSEAGGAQNGIYDASGGNGNAWPDGALTLLGFEARILARPGAAKTAPRRSGRFILGSVALAGAAIDESQPSCFADALAGPPGRYRLGIEVRDAFQGLPVLERVLEFTYDPADPAQAGRRLAFDDAGLRQSWIRCRVERDGAVVSTWERRWERDRAPENRPLPCADTTLAPSIGRMRLNAQRAGGVYAPGEPLVATVRAYDGIDRIAWRLRPALHDDLLAEGGCPAAVPAGGFQDLAIALPATAAAGRTAWRLEVVGLAGGREIDRQECLLGRRLGPAELARPRAGLRRTRAMVKAASYVRLTYLPPKGQAPRQEAEALAHVRAMLDESGPITRDVTYMIDLSEFEVLPGVFDVAFLDQVMEAAADRGCGLTIRLCHGESKAPYRWHPYTRPRNWDGSVVAGHAYYGAYAVTDEAFIASWLRAFRALYDRYGAHAGFQGYYVMLPSGEWNVPDMPWQAICSGYAWCDAAAFRAWLRDRLQLDLAALNARWGSAFASWDAVKPPAPDFAAGPAPDRRLAWLDFSRFKTSLDEDWCGRAAAAIRAYAPDHVIIGYSLDGGVRLDGLPHPDVVAHADYMHNGGNHTLQWENTLTAAWGRGLGWITEPHDPHAWASYGDPSERGWTLDWSTYVMTAQAGAGGANLHVYYWPNPGLSLAAHYGGKTALDRLQRLRPILEELHGMQLVDEPKRVAVWQDPTTLYAKHRTVFASRRQDLRRWFEQLKDDAVPYEDFRADHAGGYRLIVLNPLDEVVGRDLVEEVDRRVRAGATVLISGRVGRWCPELGADEFPLLRRLGIAPPVGAYVRDETGVRAPATAASPLLPATAAIPFYTQAENAAELADPAIGARFWSWPYRWLPNSDYFGRFTGAAAHGAEVLARFADGGAALSVHAVGAGRAVVLWGTPRVGDPAMAGFMQRLAGWCDAGDPRAGSPLPRMLEGCNPALNRRYALFWQDRPGDYVARIPSIPDGEWFIDELNSGQRLGVYTGAEIRGGVLRLAFIDGFSPLKVLRLMPRSQVGFSWDGRFRLPPR